jgi:type II secretory pathway component PulF
MGSMAHPALSLAELTDLCRSLRHYLGAGLTLVDVFKNQAKRGPARVRELASDIARELGRGRDLEHALKLFESSFPPLLIEMAVAGEQSGTLPEVFEELERYFRLREKLRKNLRAKLAGPIIQLILGVLIVMAVLLILGALGSKFDPIGLGVTGVPGAMLFLAIVLGLLGGMAAFWFGLRRSLRRRAGVDAWLLRRPVVGPCLHALALHRFSVALGATTATGMPIAHAISLSLRATGNEAYRTAEGGIIERIGKGSDLAHALSKGKVFPREYLDMIKGADLVGKLDDVLEHQAKYYAEESERRLAALTTALSWAVYCFVGLLLVFIILRMGTSYINALGV